VAGFFAVHKQSSTCEESCIVLLNSIDLASIVDKAYTMPHFRDKPKPAIVRPETPNLWRIEAQSCVFLFVATCDFESITRRVPGAVSGRIA
jgi:hypothetical protein